MRFERHQGRRRLLHRWLIIGAVTVPACRLGYQELDDVTLGAGMAAAPTGGDSNGGTASGTSASGTTSGASASGGKGSDGGSTQGDAGAVPLEAAGQTSQGGVGATAGQTGTPAGAPPLGDAGAIGVAGAPPINAPACQSTGDCSCVTTEDAHAYWFCKNLVNYATAEAHCETQSMHLVRVDSAAEANMLTNQGMFRGVFDNDGYALVGASDQLKGGEWRWVDGTQFWQGGTAGAPVGGLYANWFVASPSASGAKQCAGILVLGSWQDRSCTALESFICEAP